MTDKILTSADIVGKAKLTLTLPFDIAMYVKEEAGALGDTPSKIVERILRNHYEEEHG